MKQSTIPLYIRFGGIPEDGKSRVHRSDEVVREEAGVSVWKAIESDGKYWPILPDEPNDNAISDYFDLILNKYKHRKVYLVTGTPMFIEGADREPLLMNCQIIKDITWQFQRDDDESIKSKDESEECDKSDDINYGIIYFGDSKIQGKVTTYKYLENDIIDLILNDKRYITSISNVLLMHDSKYDSIDRN